MKLTEHKSYCRICGCGYINVPHGWSDDMNVNRLTSTTRDVDALTGMVLCSGLEVSVKAV